MSVSASVPIHAFIDLSRGAGSAAVEIEFLRRMDALGGPVERATIVSPEKVALPNRWTRPSVSSARACEQAFFEAADAGAHLLVVFDGARPTSDAMGSLAATLARDPLFGIAHPRFSDVEGQRVSPSMESDGASRSNVARGVLAMVPGFYVTTECLSPCFLIRRELVANLAPKIERWIDARGLFAEYSIRARRLGFRTVISNRVVVRLQPGTAGSAEVQPDARDVAVIRSTFPELERARREFSRVEVFEDERLVSQFFDGPERWLLDGRNLVGRVTVNGTVKAILGICDGLYAARRGSDMTLWVTAAAAECHGLERRYAGWQIITSPPADRFGAALRLTQPLQLSEALDLHALAPVNVFLMLDTIAWDVVYPASGALEKTWSYLAAYADGVLFISEFSRQRFQTRFAVSPSVRSGVVHLSLDPADYAADVGSSVASDPYWLIVGNSYDHKFLTPTLDLITRAFPGKKMIAVGEREPKRGPRVTQLESGLTDESRMQALYANAEILVFPSFYEGFGLPVVNALAYGRTVVARDSALVREISGAYQGPGRLVVYESETDLVDRLSRLAHGRRVPEIALESAGRAPIGWSQVGREIEAFLDDLVRGASPTQTRARAGLTSMLGGTDIERQFSRGLPSEALSSGADQPTNPAGFTTDADAARPRTSSSLTRTTTRCADMAAATPISERILEYERSLPAHRSGTVDESVLRAIETLSPSPLDWTMETGCGKTTILLSNLSASHYVFSVDDSSEDDSSVTYFRCCPFHRADRTHLIAGPTQQTLPSFVFDRPIDLALLDGPHGYPFPDFEYFHVYPHLRTGALLVVDDIHIPTIHQLYRFLAEDEMFELLHVEQNTAFFRRTAASTFSRVADGWWEQRYNKARFPVASTDAAVRSGE